HHDVHVVLDQQNRCVACNLAHQFNEGVDLTVGKALCRLVEDQQPWLQRKPHRYLKKALMSVGEASRLGVCMICHADTVEYLENTLMEGSRIRPATLEQPPLNRQGDIVVDTEIGEHAGDLK